MIFDLSKFWYDDQILIYDWEPDEKCLCLNFMHTTSNEDKKIIFDRIWDAINKFEEIDNMIPIRLWLPDTLKYVLQNHDIWLSIDRSRLSKSHVVSMWEEYFISKDMICI